MKHIIYLIVFLLLTSCKGGILEFSKNDDTKKKDTVLTWQPVHKKVYNKENIKQYSEKRGCFLFVFRYDTNVVEIPMTSPPGPPHYNSIVSVYKKKNNSYNLISSFNCQFTNGLCYEDDPRGLVTEALSLHKERKRKTIENSVELTVAVLEIFLDN